MEPAFRFRLDVVSSNSIEGVRSLLEAPSPAVLTTYRRDGSAAVSPVWFRWIDGWFEVVIARGDPKLRHLARDRRCILTVFETVRPFRGVEVRGISELVEGDVTSVRAAIGARYLGEREGARLAVERQSIPGTLLRLPGDNARIWDLASTLPK
jgi:Pyridoxamine 5'-phosphate oxidase